MSLVSNVLNPGYEQFRSSSAFVAGISLVDIKDSDHSLIPNGCTIQQIAIQKEPLLPWEQYFTIDESLWIRMSEVNKAALTLHEIIFREALMNTHVNSILTRKLTGFLLSTLFEATTSPDYLLSTLERTNIFRSLNERDFHVIHNHVLLKVSPPIAELPKILQSNNYKVIEIKAIHDIFVKEIIDPSWNSNYQFSETNNLQGHRRIAIRTSKTYSESLSMLTKIKGLDASYIERCIKPVDSNRQIRIDFLFIPETIFKLDYDYADAEIQIEFEEADDACAGWHFSNLKLNKAFRKPMTSWLVAGVDGVGDFSRIKISDLPKGTVLRDPSQKLQIPEIHYDPSLNTVFIASTMLKLISTDIVDYRKLKLKIGTEFGWYPGGLIFPLSKKLELGAPSLVKVSIKYLSYLETSIHEFAANTVSSRIDGSKDDIFYVESGELVEDFILERTGYGTNMFQAQAGAKVKDNKLVFPLTSTIDFEIAPQALAHKFTDRKQYTLRFAKGFEFKLFDNFFEIQGDLIQDFSMHCLFQYSNDDSQKIYYREMSIKKTNVSMTYDIYWGDLIKLNFDLNKQIEAWPYQLDLSKRIQIDDGCIPKTIP